MADDISKNAPDDAAARQTKPKATPTATLASTGLAPSDYVIIGGTGDLALRKIFPALFWRLSLIHI